MLINLFGKIPCPQVFMTKTSFYFDSIRINFLFFKKRSKIVSLLKTNEQKEMPLTRFISLYEAKYNQSIAINELFNLKEIVQIFHKDGQGRQIKLIGRNVQANLDSEVSETSSTKLQDLYFIVIRVINARKRRRLFVTRHSAVCTVKKPK